MQGLFSCSFNLRNIIGLTSFDVSNARDISVMFADCENLNIINLSSFN